eukprot:scaffold31_cov263-Pinguiococcus_pyrenoidosus.AAC.48
MIRLPRTPSSCEPQEKPASESLSSWCCQKKESAVGSIVGSRRASRRGGGTYRCGCLGNLCPALSRSTTLPLPVRAVATEADAGVTGAAPGTATSIEVRRGVVGGADLVGRRLQRLPLIPADPPPGVADRKALVLLGPPRERPWCSCRIMFKCYVPLGQSPGSPSTAAHQSAARSAASQSALSASCPSTSWLMPRSPAVRRRSAIRPSNSAKTKIDGF